MMAPPPTPMSAAMTVGTVGATFEAVIRIVVVMVIVTVGAVPVMTLRTPLGGMTVELVLDDDLCRTMVVRC